MWLQGKTIFCRINILYQNSKQSMCLSHAPIIKHIRILIMITKMWQTNVTCFFKEERIVSVFDYSRGLKNGTDINIFVKQEQSYWPQNLEVFGYVLFSITWVHTHKIPRCKIDFHSKWNSNFKVALHFLIYLMSLLCLKERYIH